MAPPLSGSSPLCSRPYKPTQLPPRSVSVWSRPPRLSATAKPGSTPRVATPLTVGLTSYLALAPPLSGYSPTSLPALPRLAPAHRGFSPSWPETQRAAGARLAHVEARRTFSRVFPALAGSGGLPGWSLPRAASADWAAAEKKPPPGSCGLKTWRSPTELFFVLTGLEFSRGRKGVGLRARTHAQCTLGPGPSALPRHDGKIFRISWRKWATAAGGYRAEASESIIGEPWNVVL